MLYFEIDLFVSLINSELKWWQQIIQPFGNFKKYNKFTKCNLDKLL